MTGSSNDLSESLKTSTRSVNTTGPSAALLMTRNSMPSMPGGPGRMNDEIVLAMSSLPVTGVSGMLVDGVVGEKCSQLDSPDVVGPRRAEPPHHLDRVFHLAPPGVELRRTAWCAGFRRSPKRRPGSTFASPVREYSE